MIFLIKKIFLFILIFSFFGNVHAGDIQLKTMIRTIYPEKIDNSSIYKLMEYILEGTDYSIYIGKNAPDDAKKILSNKPGYQRPGVLMTRIDAILMAISEENSIVVDYDKKLISVTRNPIYDN